MMTENASQILNRQILSKAHEISSQNRRHYIEVLEELSGLDSETFISAISVLLQYPPFTMQDMHRMKVTFESVPYAEAIKHHCVEFVNEGTSFVVIADPFNADLIEWIEARVHHRFLIAVAHRNDILAILSMHEDSMRAMDGLSGQNHGQNSIVSDIEDLSLLTISADTSHVVKLVHSTLYDALKSGVSDIHLEADAAGLNIKYRIDGVLAQVFGVNGVEVAEQVISRIKIMSELDIAERRVPQDGRFKIAMQGREVDFRVSIMPNIHGEDAVLRILDRSTLSDRVTGLTLEQLGFDESTIKHFRKMSQEPYGMVLVTGPTGSGKTTTLYAAISEVNHGHDKIVTIEDPVEYQLRGVLQIPVNEKKGLTFARGLRSILRHDPDKIMVGEIRDPETAQIAIQSALTGHLVFTTVHANNVFDVISRFTHMGVDPYSFVSAMNGIVSQRLVRKICLNCVTKYQPSMELLETSGLSMLDVTDFNFQIGKGCGQCRGTGYKGRKAIAEILDLNDEIRELIVGKEPIRKVKDAAKRSGTRYLREVAIHLVKDGITTLQEINRVTFVD